MLPHPRLLLGIVIGAVCVGLTWEFSGTGIRTEAQSAFASEIAALSEPPGYFDTDNLISNERSYLDVVPELKARGVKGGAYIGVGPDQNFSYIAAIRPEVVYIVDVRRDNLLLHLLCKSIFSLARTRVEYLALLLGRQVPADLDAWRGATIDRIVAHAESEALDARAISALRARVDEAVAKTGVTLSPEDRATIERFHRRFIEAGVGLRFQSTGRPPQSHYPTYRELLLGGDEPGARANFLASEDAFQFLKDLEQRDLVIPVVGDLSGARALTAIGQRLRQRGQRLSAVYASNVEFYLFGDARFDRFVANLGSIPRTEQAVIIRSVFGRFSMGGGGSSSHLQSIGDLVTGYGKGRFRYYGELVDGR
jgi:hypothetical protein